MKWEALFLNIMYVLHESGPSFNGASRSALSLIQAASAAGDSLCVVVPLMEGKLIEELRRIPNVEIIESRFYRWKIRRKSNKIKRLLQEYGYTLYYRWKNRILAHKLSNIARKKQIDIIHSNSSVIDMGGLIHAETGIPHVWHVREFGEEDFDMYPLDSEKYFYEFLYNQASEIICISEAIANKLRKYIPSDKIEVIYNGVDFPDQLTLHSDNNNLLISGMISLKKGQWIAVQAIDILRKKHIDVKLSVAGKGDLSTLGKAYEDNAESVHILGFVNDMKSLRKKMDIELMCSVSEGFGRTIVEAMASGLLVIAANGGAASEIIEDGVNGFLFEVNNPESLAEVIEKVLALDYAGKKAIREFAFFDASSKYTTDIYVSNVRNSYLQLI